MTYFRVARFAFRFRLFESTRFRVAVVRFVLLRFETFFFERLPAGVGMCAAPV